LPAVLIAITVNGERAAGALVLFFHFFYFVSLLTVISQRFGAGGVPVKIQDGFVQGEVFCLNVLEESAFPCHFLSSRCQKRLVQVTEDRTVAKAFSGIVEIFKVLVGGIYHSKASAGKAAVCRGTLRTVAANGGRASLTAISAFPGGFRCRADGIAVAAAAFASFGGMIGAGGRSAGIGSPVVITAAVSADAGIGSPAVVAAAVSAGSRIGSPAIVAAADGAGSFFGGTAAFGTCGTAAGIDAGSTAVIVLIVHGDLSLV